MHPWLAFTDALRVALFSLAHVAHGSTGAAILALSVLVRLAILPLTVKVALRAKESTDKMKALEPHMKLINERHKGNAVRIATETAALQKKHGIRFFTPLSLLTMLIQMPLGLGLYRVIAENAARAGRFLWIADLAKPDALITAIAATTASLGLLLMPASSNASKAMPAITTALLTAYFVWRLASGTGLYWIGSSAVGVAQSLIVRRISSRNLVAKQSATMRRK